MSRRRRSPSFHKSKRQRHTEAPSGVSSINTSHSQARALSSTGENSSPPEREQAQSEPVQIPRNNTSSSFKRSLHLYFVLTGLLLAIMGIVLNALGRLPAPIVEIASSIGALLALIAALWGHIGRFFLNMWRQAHPARAFLLSLATVIALIGGTYLYSNRAIIRPIITPASGNEHTSTITPQSDIPEKTTNSAGVSPIQHLTPFCGSAEGTEWDTPSQGTHLLCSNQGLVMRQNSRVNYATLELGKIDGKPYELGVFNLLVQVTFQNPVDTDTWAGLLFSTLEAGNTSNFELALNSGGMWQLTIGEAGPQIDGMLAINPSQPVAVTVMVMIVKYSGNTQKMLFCLINNSFIVSYGIPQDEIINLIRLRVEQPDNAVSSPVLYSNFNLNSEGGTQ